MIEVAEAINGYAQRLAVEKDQEPSVVMTEAQNEEFIHFGMDLEFLLRRTPIWRNTLACGVKNMLFEKGDLIELAEKAEEAIHEDYIEQTPTPPFIQVA